MSKRPSYPLGTRSMVRVGLKLSEFVDMRISVIVFAIALGGAAPMSANAQQLPEAVLQGIYSVDPLRDPLFDPAAVVVRTTRLNNWLAGNIRNLTYEQMQGPRENLYYLIESRIKQLYAEESRVLPKKPDPILEMLFSWSEYLGVFGGADAFNAIKAPNSKLREPGMQLPVEIKLALNKGLFTIRSDRGWSVRIPYYFMISQIGDFTATGGSRTQLVGFSTGAAKDKSALGYSQATVLFLFSPPETRFESFESYWLKQMGIEASTKKAPLKIRNLQSRHVVDESLKMHKEFTAWSDSTGLYGVMYAGIEGTYEWNRPHFLDFLRAIETKGSSPPNK